MIPVVRSTIASSYPPFFPSVEAVKEPLQKGDGYLYTPLLHFSRENNARKLLNIHSLFSQQALSRGFQDKLSLLAQDLGELNKPPLHRSAYSTTSIRFNSYYLQYTTMSLQITIGIELEFIVGYALKDGHVEVVEGRQEPKTLIFDPVPGEELSVINSDGSITQTGMEGRIWRHIGGQIHAAGFPCDFQNKATGKVENWEIVGDN